MSHSAADKTWEGNNTLGDTDGASDRSNKLGRYKATITVPAAGIVAGTYSTDLTIPEDAVVRRVFYKVRTTFTSATDAATISLGVETGVDVFAAVAISAAADWDAAAPIATLVTGAETAFVETTAARTLDYVVAVETLTAGSMDVWVEYDV